MGREAGIGLGIGDQDWLFYLGDPADDPLTDFQPHRPCRMVRMARPSLGSLHKPRLVLQEPDGGHPVAYQGHRRLGDRDEGLLRIQASREEASDPAQGLIGRLKLLLPGLPLDLEGQVLGEEGHKVDSRIVEAFRRPIEPAEDAPDGAADLKRNAHIGPGPQLGIVGMVAQLRIPGGVGDGEGFPPPDDQGAEGLLERKRCPHLDGGGSMAVDPHRLPGGPVNPTKGRRFHPENRRNGWQEPGGQALQIREVGTGQLIQLLQGFIHLPERLRPVLDLGLQPGRGPRGERSPLGEVALWSTRTGTEGRRRPSGQRRPAAGAVLMVKMGGSPQNAESAYRKRFSSPQPGSKPR